MTKVAKPEFQVTTLGYDYENRVTSLSTTGGVNDTFSYNGLDTKVGKVDANGSHSFRRDGASVTDPVLNDGTSEYTPGISQTSEAGTTFNASDRMGSNVLQTNSSQSSTSATQYDAFGNLVSSSGSQAGPFGFNGQYGYQTDSDTNLQLLGHRYYDPTTGRFLTRDPAKDGTNWYDYAGNSPSRCIDQSGLCIVAILLGVVAAIVLIHEGYKYLKDLNRTVERKKAVWRAIYKNEEDEGNKDSSTLWRNYQEHAIHNNVVPVLKKGIESVYEAPTEGISIGYEGPEEIREACEEIQETIESVEKFFKHLKGASKLITGSDDGADDGDDGN